jgi:predicted Zn-dependent protease
MNLRFKNKEISEERQFYRIRLALFSFFFTFFSIFINAQDSIPANQDLSEEAELKFQQFFFKALSEKAIGNYQKALENLENCNQLLENDVAVFFEFSKNHLLLKNTLLAKEYIERALQQDVDNVWMLKHLVKIYQQENNLEAAIKTQQKIVALNPNERAFLVRLYLYNRQYKEAISLMNVLEDENLLSSNLKSLKASLEKRKKPEIKAKKLSDITSLITQFETEKSYTILEQILRISEENSAQLLKFSEEGVLLFPAQPFVYLMKGKALNYQKNHKEALSVLENGFDFVIDDKMEASFYLEMAKAYKGLGNLIEENKYQQKADKLKS